MAIQAITTAGMTVKYKLGTSTGRPTTGSYTEIPGVTALPPTGDTINAIQCTPLNETQMHHYAQGLSDPGGAVQITINDAEAARDAWDALVAAYEGQTGEKYPVWFEYVYPANSGMDSFYYPGIPVPLGFGGAEVDSILSNTCNVLPQGSWEFAAASA